MSNNRRTLNTDLHPKANLALSVPRKMGNRMYSRSDEAEIMAIEVFLLSMMVVLLLNDVDDPNEGYPAKLENYPIVLKLTHRDYTLS